MRGAKSGWTTIAASANRNDACIVAEALCRQFGKATFGFAAPKVEVWHVKGFLPHEKGPACTDRMDAEGWTSESEKARNSRASE